MKLYHKKLELGCYPTPLQRIRRVEKEFSLPAPFYVKREDLSGLGPGGNKVRCMEYLLEEAVSEGCDTVVASGPYESNLCTTAAAACAALSLDCTLVYNSSRPRDRRGNMVLNQILDVNEVFLGPCSGVERNEKAALLCDGYRAEGKKPFLIENGASTGLGVLGYIDMLREIKEELENGAETVAETVLSSAVGTVAETAFSSAAGTETALGVTAGTVAETMSGAAVKTSIQTVEEEGRKKLGRIFVPGGNGGIAAGLICGNYLENMPFEITVISVEHRKEVLAERIKKLLKETEKYIGPIGCGLESLCEITDCYAGEGWGRNTEESSRMVNQFPRLTGIYIENIYCSKTVAGAVTEAGKDLAGLPVIYIHTGGFASLFAQCGPN